MKIPKLRLFKNEKGAAAVEFALVLPIIVMFVIGIFELGLLYNNWIAITHAAREGARMAAVGQYTEQKVKDSAPSVSNLSVTVTPIPPLGNIGDTITVVVKGAVYHLQIPLFFPPGNTIDKSFQLTSTATIRKEQ